MYQSSSDDGQMGRIKDLSGKGFVYRNKNKVLLALVGLASTGAGILMYKGQEFEGTKVEIINADVTITPDLKEMVVEIEGSIEKPGVYKLPEGARVEDLLVKAGGVSVEADRDWVGKYVNKAAKISDGQKIYIFSREEVLEMSGNQSSGESAKNNSSIKPYQGVAGVNTEGLININTASLTELDKLPGIGQVYGQNIIEHRPYSNIAELVTKGAIKQNIFEKIKDAVSVY